MNKTRFLTALGLSLLTATTLLAQPPSRGGGDSGRGGGDSRGGAPGGMSSRGGFGGGMSSRGGFSSRGGSGFDSSSFLTRLDRNGNGILDPDEQQGPAQFIISRMAQSDSSIQAGRPIPLKKITESFTKMREQRDSGRGGQPSSGGTSSSDAALTAELLVPGFGTEASPEPLLGFGAAAEMLSVTVTEADNREALERLRRYDRNRDGFLSPNELERFAGNPMDFDRNRDGKLSESELAVRYARRREGQEDANRKTGNDRGKSRKREPSKDLPDVFNGRQSYRPNGQRRLPEGLPGFFSDKDADTNGQVTMAEYAKEWNDKLINEFFNYDFNRDGVITAEEALRSVEEGGANQQTASTSSSSRTGSSSSTSAGSKTSSLSSAKPLPAGTKADAKYVKVVQRIVERYDKNKDSVLTASEWQSMLMSPAAADADRDGKITVNEYALWMQARQKR